MGISDLKINLFVDVKDYYCDVCSRNNNLFKIGHHIDYPYNYIIFLKTDSSNFRIF